MIRVAISRVVLVTVALIALAPNASADFRSFAGEVGRTPELKRIWIPFFGLGRLVVRKIHPNGVHDIKLAIFECQRGNPRVDLAGLVRRHVDSRRWSPMIRAVSGGEESHIFFEDRGKTIGLFIAVRSDEEVVVLELDVDPETFVRELESGGDFISIGR